MSVRCVRCGTARARAELPCPRCRPAAHSGRRAVTPLAELRPEAEPPLPAAHESLRARTPPHGAARRDPTPSRVHDAAAHTPPRAIVVAGADAAMASAPGPIVDPSAWFEQSKAQDDEARALPAPPRAEADSPAPFYLPAPSALMEARGGRAGMAGRHAAQDERPLPAEATASHRRRKSSAERATAPRGLTSREEKESAGDAFIESPPPSPGEIPSLIGRGRASRGRRTLIAVALCLAAGAAVGWLLSSPEPPTVDEVRARSVKPR